MVVVIYSCFAGNECDILRLMNFIRDIGGIYEFFTPPKNVCSVNCVILFERRSQVGTTDSRFRVPSGNGGKSDRLIQWILRSFCLFDRTKFDPKNDPFVPFMLMV